MNSLDLFNGYWLNVNDVPNAVWGAGYVLVSNLQKESTVLKF